MVSNNILASFSNLSKNFGIFLLISFTMCFIDQSHGQQTAITKEQKFEIATCIEKHFDALDVDPEQIGLRNSLVDLCYRIAYGMYMLDDFRIRKAKFEQQSYDEMVMLWMVVVITISGVILAAVQLLISYRLARIASQSALSDSTDIVVERDRLIFRSSVNGLAILLISFAFFLVFVVEIYTIREINIDSTHQNSVVPPKDDTGNPPPFGYGSGQSAPAK